MKRKHDGRPVLRLYGAMDGAMMRVRGDKDHPWRELKIGAWFQRAWVWTAQDAQSKAWLAWYVGGRAQA